MQDQQPYVVTWRLGFSHAVSVGVLASGEEAAIDIARKCLADGTLWDGGPQRPLLSDEWEEIPGGPPQWEAEKVDAFPPADFSVAVLDAREKAFAACRALAAACDAAEVGGGPVDWLEIGEAARLSREALALVQDGQAAR